MMKTTILSQVKRSLTRWRQSLIWKEMRRVKKNKSQTQKILKERRKRGQKTRPQEPKRHNGCYKENRWKRNIEYKTESSRGSSSPCTLPKTWPTWTTWENP